MIIKGYSLAIIELFLFYKSAAFLKKSIINLKYIEPILYYWVTFTILTGIWEIFYVFHRLKVNKTATKLLHQKRHVWTNNYNLKFLLPWNFSRYFYAEYGAYADREYITSKDIWSLVIESSHAFFCGLNCLLGLIAINLNDFYYGVVFISIAMAFQLMNSILYMSQYLIQVHNKNSINYNRKAFPSGYLLLSRPFMYVNILWTVMPMYVLYIVLF